MSGSQSVHMRRGYVPYDTSTSLEQYTIALLFVAALVALLARTLFVAFRLWRDRARWKLGLVIAMGEVFAVLELSLYAATVSTYLTGSNWPPFSMVPVVLLFSHLAHLASVVSMTCLLHRQRRSLSLGHHRPQNFQLLRVIYYIFLAAYTALIASYSAFSFVYPGNQQLYLGVVTTTHSLYALLAIGWLVFAILLYNQGRSNAVPPSVVLLLVQLVVVAGAILDGVYFAFADFEKIVRCGCLDFYMHIVRSVGGNLVGGNLVVCTNYLITYFGLLLIYSKQDKWDRSNSSGDLPNGSHGSLPYAIGQEPSTYDVRA